MLTFKEKHYCLKMNYTHTQQFKMRIKHAFAPLIKKSFMHCSRPFLEKNLKVLIQLFCFSKLRPFPESSSETQGQLVGPKTKSKRAGKISTRECFPASFDFVFGPTNCPWVSEDATESTKGQ